MGAFQGPPAWPIGADSRRGHSFDADAGWSDDQIRSVTDQVFQALLDVGPGGLVVNTRD